jgi:hypothetical protein
MQGNTDVDALMLAGAALLALLVVIAVAHRRAARRAADAEAEAEARARARRRPLPVVSANLRGQLARPPATDRDLWAETAADPPREVPPLGVARPDL